VGFTRKIRPAGRDRLKAGQLFGVNVDHVAVTRTLETAPGSTSAVPEVGSIVEKQLHVVGTGQAQRSG